MKRIVYQMEIPAETAEIDGKTIVIREAYLQEKQISITDETRDVQIAEAMKEAYNGECTIEDDGEPELAPTQLDRIEAQTTYTAMMTDTLLEG